MEWLTRQQGKLESMLVTMQGMAQKRMGGLRVEFRTLPRDTTWINIMDLLQLGCNWFYFLFPEYLCLWLIGFVQVF